MGTWIEVLFGTALLAMAWLGVRALSDLREQIEAMKRAVEDIGSALERQHTETRNTLQAIAASVDNTAGSLRRIESAMPAPMRQRL
jgi:hypothetical protein